MKYVYVLTSSEKDTYYEQFYLSLASMRLYNPDAEVVALIDEKTKHGLTGKRSGYEEFVSDIKVIKAPDEFSQKETSRWIKTSIRDQLSGDFLFIDCDTIITEKLEYEFPKDIKIGAVLDTHVPLSVHHQKKEFLRQISASGFNEKNQIANYFNSGVIFCRDTHETVDFYNCWNELWMKSNTHGVYADQPSLNQANYKFSNIIHELPGEWNCQISHNGLPFLQNAKIIHCFASVLLSTEHPYKLASSVIFASIKETGELSPQIMKLLESPKTAFEPISRIISDRAVIDALDSFLFFKLIKFSRRYPGPFKKWKTFTDFITRISKRLFKL
jgi:hypothetical protein